MTELINRKQVEYITGMSRSSIYAMMKQGRFPRQVQCGKRAVRWYKEDIERWSKNPMDWVFPNLGDK